MFIYKLQIRHDGQQSINRSDGWSIPFDPANTDYQTFKAEILNDEATLQDADGVEMTPDAAKEFIRTLP